MRDKIKNTKTQAERKAERDAKNAEQAQIRAQEAEKKREAHLSKLGKEIEVKVVFVPMQPSLQNAEPGPSAPRRARIVMNHSTHIDGLIKLLRLVSARLDSRFTITPGALSSSGTSTSKQGGISIRTQRSDDESSMRLLATNNNSMQDLRLRLKCLSLCQKVIANVELW